MKICTKRIYFLKKYLYNPNKKNIILQKNKSLANNSNFPSIRQKETK